MGSNRILLGGVGALALALFCVGREHGRAAAAPAGPVPVGTVLAFTGERVPEGWLLADGRSLRRSDWPALYRAIGTSHGEGVSTLGVKEADFNLPDYRGRFLRGVDLAEDGRRLNADVAADARAPARAGTGNAGNRVGSYQPDGTALPRDPLEPFRTVVRVAAAAGAPTPGRGTGALRAGTPLAPGGDDPRTQKYLLTGGDAETRPKNVAVRWIIRATP